MNEFTKDERAMILTMSIINFLLQKAGGTVKIPIAELQSIPSSKTVVRFSPTDDKKYIILALEEIKDDENWLNNNGC